MNKVSVRKIILNDYAAFLLTVAGPIMLAISGFTAVFGFIPRFRLRGGQAVGPEAATIAFVIAVVLTLLLLFLLARRISRISRILASGPRTRAKVLNIAFFKDRGRMEFEYPHDGEIQTTGTAIMKNKHTTAIGVGDEIEIAIDRSDPSRALVVGLYCN